MKKISLIVLSIFLLLLAGCGGGKYLELTTQGEQSFADGDYASSLHTAEQIISELEAKGQEPEAKVYAFAGKSSYKLEDFTKARNYLEKAQQLGYADEEMYIYLSGIYRSIDNLSREITALETYLEKYSDGTESGQIRGRLYQTCIESENYELADQLWTLMDSTSKNQMEVLDVYLTIQLGNKNDSACEWAATQIINQDSSHEQALKWFGEKYFWLAENRYQAEMEAYEKKKTRSQYSKLLKAFKIVTADFKQSLEYYSTLYELYPKAEYASYLGNIYARLDNKEKAEYYRSKAS